MGIEQEAVLNVNTGSLSLSKGDKFDLRPTPGVDINVISDLEQKKAVAPNEVVKIKVKVFCKEKLEDEDNIKKQVVSYVITYDRMQP